MRHHGVSVFSHEELKKYNEIKVYCRNEAAIEVVHFLWLYRVAEWALSWKANAEVKSLPIPEHAYSRVYD